MSWIKMHRDIERWEWRDSPNHLSVFIDLLTRANYEDGKYRGSTVPKGSLTTSASKIGSRTGLSRQQIRSVLCDLESTNEITIKTTNKYTMISITKWDYYQGDNQQVNHQDNHQTNHQITTSKKLINKEFKKEELTPSAKIAAGGAIVAPEFLVIDYLNATLKKSFKQTDSNHKPIKARLKEGYTVDEMKSLIDHIGNVWVYDSFWQNQIKIPTIFSIKFDGYYQESINKKLDPIEDFFASNNCAPMEN